MNCGCYEWMLHKKTSFFLLFFLFCLFQKRSPQSFSWQIDQFDAHMNTHHMWPTASLLSTSRRNPFTCFFFICVLVCILWVPSTGKCPTEGNLSMFNPLCSENALLTNKKQGRVRRHDSKQRNISSTCTFWLAEQRFWTYMQKNRVKKQTKNRWMQARQAKRKFACFFSSFLHLDCSVDLFPGSLC